MNPYRTLPVLETTRPTSTAESLGHVRGWLEEMTDTNPYTGIDWSTYQSVLQLSGRSDYRPLVEAVLKQRLDTTGPSAHKALLLAQTLPVASLVPLIDPLKKLAAPAKDEPPSHLNLIAASLVEAAEKHKAEAAKKKAESQWDIWCASYGKPSGEHAFPPLPSSNPEWGVWGLVPVSADEWWKAPDKP